MGENVIPMTPGAEIVMLEVVTSLDLPADRILQGALDCGLKGVVIVGVDEDGKEYFASSWASAAEASWHLQRGIHKLHQMTEQLEEQGIPA